MARIGSRAHAAQALGFGYDPNLPNWSRLSGGGCRRVFRHDPTNVVYKLDDEWTDDLHSNAMELHNARTLWRRSDNGWISHFIRVPRTSGFNIYGQLVLAMEFVPGELGRKVKHAIPEQALKELAALQFGDMHAENFIWHDGVIWPIDMGSPRSSRKYGGGDFEPDPRAARCAMW